MSRNLQFVLAIVMIVVAITTAPALLCVGYLSQTSQLHDCCPSSSVPGKSVPVCCVQSPAVTSHVVDFSHSAVLVAIVPVAYQQNVTILKSVLPAVSSAESPGSSTVLRI